MTSPDLRASGMPVVGGVFAGRYEIRGELGAGGMGAVYRAYHRELDREVALKVMLAQTSSEAHLQRFLREMRLTARLDHPHTVRVFDVGSDAGVAWFTMELLEGESLGKRIERGGPMAVAEVVAIARQVCLALGAAHARSMVHRDLKPDNVMLSPVFGQKDFVRVLDFGIAYALTPGDEPKLTATNAILGTPHYIAPEQVIARPLDARADLYALGCVLYEMLTGRPPFYGSELMPTLLRHMNEAPVPVAEAARAVGRAVPSALARLVDQLLAKEPSARPPSAAAVIDVLDRCLDETHASLAPPAQPTPSPLVAPMVTAPTAAAPRVDAPSKTRRRLLVAVALVALVVLGGAALFEEELGLPTLLGYSDDHADESRRATPAPAPTPAPTPPSGLDPAQARSAEESAYLDLMELTAKGSWDEANQRLATAPAPTTGPYAEPLRLFRSMIASHVARDAAP